MEWKVGDKMYTQTIADSVRGKQLTPEQLWEAAHVAGHAAAEACRPVPMRIWAEGGGQVWNVPDGVCGFAEVRFPGNTAFGRAMKKAGIARPTGRGGLYVWVSDYGQSLARKEAYARAAAEVLVAGGVKAWAESRMD